MDKDVNPKYGVFIVILDLVWKGQTESKFGFQPT